LLLLLPCHACAALLLFFADAIRCRHGYYADAAPASAMPYEALCYARCCRFITASVIATQRFRRAARHAAFSADIEPLPLLLLLAQR